MRPDLTALARRHPTPTAIIGVVGIAGIGVVDYFTGTELRVFPLYYMPLAILAWRFGRNGALVATVLSGGMWLVSNALAGLEYALTSTWVLNTAMQVVSFGTVGFLIAAVRSSLMRERGLSRTDPLTGVLNRKGFYEEAARLIALCRRNARPMTVGYLDLDNFKAINDSSGTRGATKS